MVKRPLLAILLLIGCVSVQGCSANRLFEGVIGPADPHQELIGNHSGRESDSNTLGRTEDSPLRKASDGVSEKLDRDPVIPRQTPEREIAQLQRERENLSTEIAALQQVVGSRTQEGRPQLTTLEPGNLQRGRLAEALQEIRQALQQQVEEFTALQQERARLVQDIQSLETKLQKIAHESAAQEAVLMQQQRERAQLSQEVQQLQANVDAEIEQVARIFKKELGDGLRVEHRNDRLILTVLDQVLFESGEADLTPLGLEVMKRVGKVLAGLPNKYIQIEGHTDTNPIHGQLRRKYPTNWELSTARATTVLRFLIEKTEMNPDHFVAAGYADTRPVASNDTEEGRARNRRVEIVLYPRRIFYPNKEPHPHEG